MHQNLSEGIRRNEEGEQSMKKESKGTRKERNAKEREGEREGVKDDMGA